MALIQKQLVATSTNKQPTIKSYDHGISLTGRHESPNSRDKDNPSRACHGRDDHSSAKASPVPGINERLSKDDDVKVYPQPAEEPTHASPRCLGPDALADD